MLKDVLKKRYTTKWWDSKPVKMEDINNIISVAYNAPSKQGYSDYQIHVITDSEEGKKFKEWLYWDNTYCIDESLYNRNENSGKLKRFNGQVLAPVVIIWLAKKFDANKIIKINPYNEDNHTRTMNDCMVSATMALCQAEELGLKTGFCGCLKGQEVADKLGQSGYFAVISLGIGHATISETPESISVFDKNGNKVCFDLANFDPKFVKKNTTRNKRLSIEQVIKYL